MVPTTDTATRTSFSARWPQDARRQHPPPARVQGCYQRPHLQGRPYAIALHRPDNPLGPDALSGRWRGQSGCRAPGPHLHGRDGVRHGLLLLADHLPGKGSRGGDKGLRPARPRRAHHGPSVSVCRSDSPRWKPDRYACFSSPCRQHRRPSEATWPTSTAAGMSLQARSMTGRPASAVWQCVFLAVGTPSSGGPTDSRRSRRLQPLKEGERRIPKSRYDSVDSYISSSVLNRPEYSDNEVPIDEAVKERLLAHGIDAPLAHHVAHLFIRDPLVIFTETLDQDDALSTDHFENIQSTTGRRFALSRPRRTPTSAGGSSSGAWRSSRPTLKTPPTQSSSSS
jgi:hypothetical protein